MGRKSDLKEVDRIAREGGLTPEQRATFGEYLEDCKASGDRGTKNDRGDFTTDELRAKLDEFKGMIG